MKKLLSALIGLVCLSVCLIEAPPPVASAKVESAATVQINDSGIPDSFSRARCMPGARLLLIGDSLAVGMKSEFERLALANGYVPFVHAVVGTNTHMWVGWFKKVVEDDRPDLVFVSLGTNDTGFPEATIRDRRGDYSEIVKVGSDAGARVLWIGLPKLTNKKLCPHADLVKELIANSVTDYFESDKLNFPQPDGIHTSPQGYILWMDAVWEWTVNKEIIVGFNR